MGISGANGETGGYALRALGVHFRFESDKVDFLGRCLSLHYGDLCRRVSAGEAAKPGEWLVNISCGSGGAPFAAGESALEVLSGSVRIHIDTDIDNRRIRMVSAGEAELDEQEMAGFFFVCIGAAAQLGFKESGIVVFHGAAAARDGMAVLIAGGNGCGKSTLLKKLLSAGWEYLADDSAAVVLEGNVAKVVRNPELVNVAGMDGDTIAALKRKGFSPVAGAAFLAPPQEIASGELRRILFPSISSNGDGIPGRLTEKEFLLKLMEARKTPFRENEYEGFLDMCLSIAGGAHGYRYEMKSGEIPAADDFAGTISQLQQGA